MAQQNIAKRFAGDFVGANENCGNTRHNAISTDTTSEYGIRYFLHIRCTVHGIYMRSKISRSVILHRCDIINFGFSFPTHTLWTWRWTPAHNVCAGMVHMHILFALTHFPQRIRYTYQSVRAVTLGIYYPVWVMPSHFLFSIFLFVAFAFTCSHIGIRIELLQIHNNNITKSGAPARTVASSFIARMHEHTHTHRPQRCQQYFEYHFACTHTIFIHPQYPSPSSFMLPHIYVICAAFGSVIAILHRLGEWNYDMLVVTKIKNI